MAVGDPDSANFDGGLLTLSIVDRAGVSPLFQGSDGEAQDNLGIASSGSVSVSGADVRVDGALVGTIVSDGQDGAPLSLRLTAAAAPEAVEAVIEHIVYVNPSRDPDAVREIRVSLSDGDAVMRTHS